MWRSSIYEVDIKGSEGKRTTTIVCFSCRPPKPQPWHYTRQGPHGERVETLEGENRYRYTDRVTGEIIETESRRIRVMGTLEMRKKLSKGVKRFRKNNPEKAALINQSLLNYNASLEGRKRKSEAMKVLAKDPEYVEQRRQTSLANWKIDKIARKRVKGMKKALARPEVKESHSKGLKKKWAERKAKEKAILEELASAKRTVEEFAMLKQRRSLSPGRKPIPLKEKNYMQNGALVEAKILDFRRMFDVKGKPYSLNSKLRSAGFSRSEIAAAASARNSRRPAEELPVIAARHWVASSKNLSHRTISNQHLLYVHARQSLTNLTAH